MAIEIGLTYEETKLRLQRKIQDGKLLGIPAQAENQVCYFCARRINGLMMMLTEKELINGREVKERYYTHELCYKIAENPNMLN